MKKLLYAAFALIAIGLLYGDSASALKVDPALISVALNPGETKELKVKLLNNSDTPIALKAKMYSAVAGSNEQGFATFTPAQPGDTLANWLTFASTEPIALSANEEKATTFLLTLPADAAPGGHYASVGWGIITDPTAEAGPTISGEIMTNIALDVPGEVFEQGSIASFLTVDSQTKYERLPIGFSIKIQNNGNRHFKPTGNVVIKDMLGRTAALLPVNNGIGGGNVLPNSTREYKVDWKDGFALGKYTATADLILGSAGNASANYSFWVLPTALLIIWGVIALAFLLIIAFLIKLGVSKAKKPVA